MISDHNSSDMESRRKSKKSKAFISSSDSEVDDSSNNYSLSCKRLSSPPKRRLQKDLEKTSCSGIEQQSSLENTTPVMSPAVTLPISGSTKEKVERLSINSECCSPKDKVLILNQVGLSYPVTSLENLKIFETFVMYEEKYNSLVKILSKIGGSNSSDDVKRCFTTIISDKIAEKYSFIGRKEKDNFSVFYMSRALIDAAHKVSVVKDKKECENAIDAWLNRAKARMGRQGEKEKYKI